MNKRISVILIVLFALLLVAIPAAFAQGPTPTPELGLTPTPVAGATTVVQPTAILTPTLAGPTPTPIPGRPTEEPKWLDRVRWQVMGANAPYRTDYSAKVGRNLKTVNKGTLVEMDAEVTTSETGGVYFHARFYTFNATTNTATYVGHGWMTQTVAKLETMNTPVPQLAFPDCQVKGKTLQLMEENGTGKVFFGQSWIFDVNSNGCSLLAEGRQVMTEEHHIWELRSKGRVNSVDLVHGYFKALEMSVWAIDPEWNVGDFTTSKPPIAAELVDAKRKNMQNARPKAYDWPITVHLVDGTTRRYEAGKFVNEEGAKAANEGQGGGTDCTTVPGTPEIVNVTGLMQGDGSYSAQIGTTGCYYIGWGQVDTDANPDLVLFPGPWENFAFRMPFIVVTLPSGWTEEQIKGYVKSVVDTHAKGTVVDIDDRLDHKLGLPATMTSENKK